MVSRQSFRTRLMLFTACTMVAAGAPLTSSLAQPIPATSVPLPSAPAAVQTENIVVTGSRLKTTNATSENPVTVVTSADIIRSPAQTVEEVLQRLPAIGSSGVYGTTNNGGQGASCTDIRNLGINRTLVLVNGRRFVHTGNFGFDCVDLNNIPLALVDRIEILKDGASSTYGADAVAGVINIILKKNFSGTEIRVNGSVATQVGDNLTGNISATTGANFARGNVTASVDYENQGPVFQRDRSYAVPVVGNNTIGSPFKLGSGTSTHGFITNDSNSTNPLPNGRVFFQGIGQPVPYTGKGNQRFDYGQYQYLSQALERESFSATGRYDFNDYVTGYLETFFTHRGTNAQLAPQPVTGGLTANVPDAWVIPAGNPYLTQLFGADQGPVDLRKRVAEFGARTSSASADTFQINGGFEGTIGTTGWDYNTFFQYGQSDNVLTASNEVNFARLEQEVGFSARPAPPGTADVTTYGIYDPNVCQAAAGCVLINPFGPGSISQAGVNYARFTEVATSTFTLRTFGGSVTNNSVYQLPYGPVGLTFGAEHRRESGQYNPDNLVTSGVTLENAQQPTKGAFSVTEIYGESRIPLLADLPFAKDLHIDVGGRYYNYNTFGNGETWKAAFNYTPVTGIRFRGNIGTAFRQPSVQELFGGQSLSFNTGMDPCADQNYKGYANPGAVAAKCASQGINVANFTQLGNTQVQTITGGNPALTPETARTETLGTVIEPPFIPRLAFTVDYWRTKIENSIGSVQTQDILDGCYTGLNPGFCNQINPRVAQQQLGTVTAITQNLGVTKTDGIDLGLSYTYLLPPSYGSVTLQSDMQLLFNYSFQNVPNGPFIGNAGLLNVQNDGAALPRQRNNTSITWNYGDFAFGYEMRYISGVGNYPVLDPKTALNTKEPEIFYHDLNLTYAHKGTQLTVGISNVLDKAPPFVFDTATNTNPSVYDVLGRVVYIKSVFKF